MDECSWVLKTIYMNCSIFKCPSLVNCSENRFLFHLTRFISKSGYPYITIVVMARQWLQETMVSMISPPPLPNVSPKPVKLYHSPLVYELIDLLLKWPLHIVVVLKWASNICRLTVYIIYIRVKKNSRFFYRTHNWGIAFFVIEQIFITTIGTCNDSCVDAGLKMLVSITHAPDAMCKNSRFVFIILE